MLSNLLKRYFSSEHNAFRIKYLFDNKPLDEYVCVNGWVKAFRRMKSATFLDLDDGSTPYKLQVVLGSAVDVSAVQFHCGVSVSGTLRKSSHPKQEFELHADRLAVVGEMTSTSPYPFLPRRSHSPDYVRQHLHVRPRNNSFAAVMRVRAETRAALADHYRKEGFLQVDPPVITTNECEGGGEAFILKTAVNCRDRGLGFFGNNVFLSVSTQLHLEALANGLSAVYTISPAFRAEPSMGRRHLAEFWMVEAEEAFLEGETGLSTLLDRIEALVKETLSGVREACREDLQLHWSMDPGREEMVERAISRPFVRIRHTEALRRLQTHAASNEQPLEDDTHAPTGNRLDLSREDELLLTTMEGCPVFVTHWPSTTRPFYMARAAGDHSTVLCTDLLLPGVGEVVGGSVREHDPRQLELRLPKSPLNLQATPPSTLLANPMDWYVNLRRWGGVPTAGYGLGLERLLLFMLGVQNIRDVVPFPRWPGHCQH